MSIPNCPLRHLAIVVAFSSLISAANVRHFVPPPLYFEVNRGQADPSVRYVARSGNVAAFISNEGVAVTRRGDSVLLRVDGAAPSPRITAEEPTGGFSNYYLGTRTVTGAAHYRRIRVSQILPGVDMVYYGNSNQLEYDLLFSPGTDPSTVRLKFKGAGRPFVTADGDLILVAGKTEFRQRKPAAWQLVNGERRDVECSYTVGRSGEVHLTVGQYDRRMPLTVDPILSYSTYLGGTDNDAAYGIAVDSTGAVYLTGSTASPDFPATSGHNSGADDVFITKLSPNGSSVIYSTYIGGAANESGRAIAVDGSGNAYVAGQTISADFPASGLHGSGYSDAFVL
jgi:hypothetical protein